LRVTRSSQPSQYPCGFPSFLKIRDRIFEIFGELALEKGWHIRAIEVAPDHIHLFVEIHPTDAIYQVVRAFKGRSSNYLRKEFPELKKLPSLWTNITISGKSSQN